MVISHKKFSGKNFFFHFFKNGMGVFPCFCVIGVKTLGKNKT